jgi:excinuclease ABC subunit C
VRALAKIGLPMLPVIALAKREEEIFLQGSGEPVRLARSSPALHLVQRIRDEAHRFAVTHHRRKRARRTLRTALLDVPGIGPVVARKLLRAFGSVEGVLAAPPDDVARIAGRKVAKTLARSRVPGRPG